MYWRDASRSLSMAGPRGSLELWTLKTVRCDQRRHLTSGILEVDQRKPLSRGTQAGVPRSSASWLLTPSLSCATRHSLVSGSWSLRRQADSFHRSRRTFLHETDLLRILRHYHTAHDITDTNLEHRRRSLRDLRVVC